MQAFFISAILMVTLTPSSLPFMIIINNVDTYHLTYKFKLSQALRVSYYYCEISLYKIRISGTVRNISVRL